MPRKRKSRTRKRRTTKRRKLSTKRKYKGGLNYDHGNPLQHMNYVLNLGNGVPVQRLGLEGGKGKKKKTGEQKIE